MSGSRRPRIPFDPCLSCRLPDCDESDRRCGLNRANSEYSSLKKRGRPDQIPQTVRDGYNAWFTKWRLERDARRSEQRPAISHSSEVHS